MSNSNLSAYISVSKETVKLFNHVRDFNDNDFGLAYILRLFNSVINSAT